MKLYICLPAYNEEKAIGPLIQSLQENLEVDSISYEIIVVDDGSKDQTAQIVKSLPKKNITLLQHENNRGLGEAIYTGLYHCAQISQPKDIIVTMDSDNTHPVGLIFQMIRKIKEGADIVIASRYVPQAQVIGVPFLRQIYSYSASILFRLFFPTPCLKDYTCGYRAYKASLIKAALDKYHHDFVSQAGFSCMVDILLKLRKMRVIFSEVPMILRYDLKPSASKMNIPKTIKNTLILLWKAKFSNP